MTGIGSCLRFAKEEAGNSTHSHAPASQDGPGVPQRQRLSKPNCRDRPRIPSPGFSSVWPLHLCLLLQIIFSLKSCLYLLGSSKHFYPSTLILPNRTLTLAARLFMNTNKQNLGMHGGHYSREFIRILTQTQRIKTLTGHCCQKLNGLELKCRPLMLSST